MHEKCFQVVQVFGKEEKSKVTNNILRKLPKWFGIEESIVEYVNDGN